jgi:hypothetical protein
MDFEVTDVRGCAHLLRAVNVEDGEWHLKASVDGRTFTHRCKNWQVVERTLRWLRARAPQRRATAPPPTSASPRALVAPLLLLISGDGSACRAPGCPDCHR